MARLVGSTVRMVELQLELPPADRAAASELLAESVPAAEVLAGVAVHRDFRPSARGCGPSQYRAWINVSIAAAIRAPV